MLDCKYVCSLSIVGYKAAVDRPTLGEGLLPVEHTYREPVGDATSDEELLDVGDEYSDDVFGDSKLLQVDERREGMGRPHASATIRKEDYPSKKVRRLLQYTSQKL